MTLYRIITDLGRELWLGRCIEARIKQLVRHYRQWYPTAKAIIVEEQS